MLEFLTPVLSLIDDITGSWADNEQHIHVYYTHCIPHIRFLLANMNNKLKIFHVGFWKFVAMATGVDINPIATGCYGPMYAFQ